MMQKLFLILNKITTDCAFTTIRLGRVSLSRGLIFGNKYFYDVIYKRVGKEVMADE